MKLTNQKRFSKYSFLVAKTFLNFGRLFGVMFGGVQIATGKSLKLAFRVSRNKLLSRIGYIFLLLSLLWNYTLLPVLRELHIRYQNNLIAICFCFLDVILTRLANFLFILTTQKNGVEIFTFLSKSRLSFKQMSLCLSIIAFAFFDNLILSGIIPFEERPFEKYSTWKLVKYLILHPITSIPLTLAISLQLIISLFAYWRLQAIKLQLRNQHLNRFIIQFKKFKNDFYCLESALRMSNLVVFAILVTYVLNSLNHVITRSYLVTPFIQLIFDVIMLIAHCKINGLVHESSREMLKLFDNIVSEQPLNMQLVKINMLLSRESVGYKVLGCNYDESLLSSVSTFEIQKLFNF